MLALAPATPAGEPAGGAARPPRGGRTARPRGAAGRLRAEVLDPGINDATIRLLTRLGVEVVVAKGAGCCGALTHHMGGTIRHGGGAREHRGVGPGDRGRGAGCRGGQHLRLRDDGEGLRLHFPHRAGAVARRAPTRSRRLAKDISEFLTPLGYAPTRAPPGLTVAYHSACSLQHGQQVTGRAEGAAAAAGFTVVEPHEPHICCGSAGTYNLLQPEIAGRLRERKLATCARTAPDLVAAGNIGCITQLSGGGLPVVHTVELLDWMAGGPPPPDRTRRRERRMRLAGWLRPASPSGMRYALMISAAADGPRPGRQPCHAKTGPDQWNAGRPEGSVERGSWPLRWRRI